MLLLHKLFFHIKVTGKGKDRNIEIPGKMTFYDEEIGSKVKR